MGPHNGESHRKENGTRKGLYKGYIGDWMRWVRASAVWGLGS